VEPILICASSHTNESLFPVLKRLQRVGGGSKQRKGKFRTEGEVSRGGAESAEDLKGDKYN